MPMLSKTFPSLLKETGLTEEQGLELIARSDDQVSFCAEVSKRYGIELTLQEAEDIYLTAPIND